MKKIYLIICVLLGFCSFHTCLASNELYSVVLISDNDGKDLMTLQETENHNNISKINTIFHGKVGSVAASFATLLMIEKIAAKRKFSYYVDVDEFNNKVPTFDGYVRFTNNATEVSEDIKMLLDSDLVKDMRQKIKLKVLTNVTN